MAGQPIWLRWYQQHWWWWWSTVRQRQRSESLLGINNENEGDWPMLKIDHSVQSHACATHVAMSTTAFQLTRRWQFWIIIDFHLTFSCFTQMCQYWCIIYLRLYSACVIIIQQQGGSKMGSFHSGEQRRQQGDLGGKLGAGRGMVVEVRLKQFLTIYFLILVH